MPKTFKDAKTSVDDGKKWEDDLPFAMVDIREVCKGEYHGIRLVGYIEPFMRFWIPTDSSKAYDPYKMKAKQYPSICTDFDPVEEVFTGNDCLYRRAHYLYIDSDSGESKWGKLKPTKNYLIFFIDREMQEERAGFSLKKKIKRPAKYSDIKCATVPTAFAREVQNAIELHKKRTKNNVDPTHPEDGFDLFFKFDPTASAEAKYSMQLGDPSPLTDDELAQLECMPKSVSIYPKDSPAKIKESLLRHGYVITEVGQSPEDAVAATKKAAKAKSTMRAGAELVDDDDDDEEETPNPRRRAKPPVEEEFEDEDGDLDLNEDEETTPPKAEKADKKSKPVEDADDGFDFGDDDDDDDDE